MSGRLPLKPNLNYMVSDSFWPY